MSLEFTKLSEVAAAESTTGSAKLLVEDGGEVKRLPVLAREMMPQGYPYGEKKTIYWDGVDDSLGTAGEGDNMYYRISEEVPTDDEFGGCAVNIEAPDGVVSYELSSEPVYKDDSASVFLIAGQLPVYLVRAPFVDPYGNEFGKTGVFVPSVGAGITFNYGIISIDYRFLPNGYPQKEAAVISWDGNTEGRPTTDAFCKVSDDVLTNTEIKSGVVRMSNGEVVSLEALWASMEMQGLITSNYVISEMLAVVRVAGTVELFGITFPEPGVYFMFVDDTYAAEFEYKKITTMSEDFLPESAKGGGGGRFVVKASAQDETGKITAVDKTFAEISAAIESGQTVVLEAEDEGITLYYNLTAYFPGQLVMFGAASIHSLSGKANIEAIQIAPDNSVVHISGSVTLDT